MTQPETRVHLVCRHLHLVLLHHLQLFPRHARGWTTGLLWVQLLRLQLLLRRLWLRCLWSRTWSLRLSLTLLWSRTWLLPRTLWLSGRSERVLSWSQTLLSSSLYSLGVGDHLLLLLLM